MTVKREMPERNVIVAASESSGLAVAVVDGDGNEIITVNDNSICKTLNPNGKLVKECSAFCGLALAEALEIGGHSSYTCHAGLECRASAMLLDGKPVALIVGRTFVSSEKYRSATERAIDGNWSEFDPSKLFENVLLSASSEQIEKTLDRLEAASNVVEPAEPLELTAPSIGVGASPDDHENPKIETIEPDDATEIPVESEPHEDSVPPFDIVAFRSFFSSILNKDYESACTSFLELVSRNYSLDSIAWLERRDQRLAAVAALGALRDRRINLGIPPDDPRLTNASKEGIPIELTERSAAADASPRTMYLFPVPVGREIPAALAVLDDIDGTLIAHQISRLCQSVGPKLEILRLRSEMTRKDSLADAVRRFSDNLKHADAADFWMQVTQIASELMQAERGSLLVLDESTGTLEIKAVIGARNDLSREVLPGNRVARIIFDRGKPALVADVELSGLPPVQFERGYKTSSFLSSPISLWGRNIAVINFTDKASGAPFGRADLELLEGILPQIAVAIDRAILKERAGELHQLSVTDELTGLLNRRYMDERLMEEVKRSNRHGYPTSFVMLDVDHFKSYNDAFGHPAGDEALRLVGQVFHETLRGADVAARYGGEEFAVLLPQTTSDEAAVIAERLRANVEAKNFPHRPVTVSIGVASCTSELCTMKSLIQAADRSLYEAKHGGRNRVRVFGYLEPERT
jgi:diguanylate cyclase (GGDEF)-like protein